MGKVDLGAHQKFSHTHDCRFANSLKQAFFVHNAKFFGSVQTKILPTLHACIRKNGSVQSRA